MVPHKQRRSPKRSLQDVKAKHRKTHSKCSQETEEGGGNNDDDLKRKKAEKKEGVVVVVVRGNNFVKRNTGGQEDRL